MKADLAPEVRASVSMPLKDAWWCVNCGCITNQSAWCPCCSATDLYPLARFLDRKPREAV